MIIYRMKTDDAVFLQNLDYQRPYCNNTNIFVVKDIFESASNNRNQNRRFF